jgi:hypothetical protein
VPFVSVFVNSYVQAIRFNAEIGLTVYFVVFYKTVRREVFVMAEVCLHTCIRVRNNGAEVLLVMIVAIKVMRC